MTSALEKYIRAWIAKADQDILSAERLLLIEPVILDNACFLCQQAMEKSLKAYLIYNGVEIEYTHRIDYLLSQCAEFDRVFSTIDPGRIDGYAVKIRYPDHALSPSLEEAKKYYELAYEIRNLTVKKIGLDIDLKLQKKSAAEPKLLIKPDKSANGLLEKNVQSAKLLRKKK
jgi:HEPN domain-containing protein